jgi:hypothetical protein
MTTDFGSARGPSAHGVSTRPSRLLDPAPASCLAADGAVVAIAAAGAAASTDQWFGSFEWRLGDRRFGFQHGPTGTVDNLMSPFGDFGWRESYSFGGGTLEIGCLASSSTSALVLWTNGFHELYYYADEPVGEAAAAAMKVLDLFNLSDDTSGVTARPRPTTRAQTYGHVMTRTIPGVGLCTVLPKEQALQMVPSWPGARVRHGELYANHSHHAERRSFHLVTQSAFTTVQIPEGEELANPTRVQALEDMDVSWTKAVPGNRRNVW